MNEAVPVVDCGRGGIFYQLSRFSCSQLPELKIFFDQNAARTTLTMM